MSLPNLKKMARSTAGYTIDQTILIVAVIAILITLVIASVGWDLLNRTGGTKLASHMRQLEDSNGTFYARMRQWPDDALAANASAINNVAILSTTNNGAALVPAGGTIDNKHNNLIPGFERDGTTMQHGFGAGGDILQQRVNLGAIALSTSFTKGSYMIIEFDDVPVSEAQEADEAVDGEADPDTGRLIIVDQTAGYTCGAAYDAADAADAKVDVCYIANLIN